MQTEGYADIINSVILAKELYDAGRYDIVQSGFFDILSQDAAFENQLGAITSIFSGCCNNYDDDNDCEVMIFTDDCISRYFEIAREYGRSHNVHHNNNPLVIEAQGEARRWLTYCHSMDHKLLGYTRTGMAARQSKLVVYLAFCVCDNYNSLARGLIRLYCFFRDKCNEFEKQMGTTVTRAVDTNTKELMAA